MNPTMNARTYYRPIPAERGRWTLAGGWVRFSECEVLRRGEVAYITRDVPNDVLLRLTAPRAPILGLSMGAPQIMAIMNVTPDSFSDGGDLADADAAIARGTALVAAGAAILDIGGESTRPGAREIPADEEAARLTPVIAGLHGLVPISADTRKAAVARAAVAAGAGMINDVSGLDFDPAMAQVTAETGAAICLMHARGLPENMQDNPSYGDVLLDVYDALEARARRAIEAGVARERIVIDPGIGFGKTEAHNLAILRRISVYHGLGYPILLGLSRKRFIGRIGGAEEPRDRMAGTLALTLAGIAQGVQIHRVHDAGEINQGLRLWSALHMREDDEQNDLRN